MSPAPIGRGRRAAPEILALARRIGHDFADPSLLEAALVHSSAVPEGSGRRPPARSNETLEFLGDRVLALAIAEVLLASDPDAPEGRIAPRFNALVRRETCADVARSVDLGAVLRLGRSEARTGGRRKEAMLADAMEAVIAAVHRDAGFEAARRVVIALWGERIGRVEEDARDAKTALQEWAQARGEEPPSYVEIAREGPDHAPVFTIEARLAGGGTARARAGSKREAEQVAAAGLLDAVGRSDQPAHG